MASQPCLHLLPLSEDVARLYKNHGTFHEGDSGLDLFVAETKVIPAGETGFIKLGVKAAAYDDAGKNVSFLIMARSSISKTPLRLSNSVGLIDAGYRGELMACLDNIKTKDHTVQFGERLVQAVYFNGQPFTFKTLPKTSRGEGGLGSTTEKALDDQPSVESNENSSGQPSECKKPKLSE